MPNAYGLNESFLNRLERKYSKIEKKAKKRRRVKQLLQSPVTKELFGGKRRIGQIVNNKTCAKNVEVM